MFPFFHLCTFGWAWKLIIREGPNCPDFKAIWTCITPRMRELYVDRVKYVETKGWDWIYADYEGSLKCWYERYFARVNQGRAEMISCVDCECAFFLVWFES